MSAYLNRENIAKPSVRPTANLFFFFSQSTRAGGFIDQMARHEELSLRAWSNDDGTQQGGEAPVSNVRNVRMAMYTKSRIHSFLIAYRTFVFRAVFSTYYADEDCHYLLRSLCPCFLSSISLPIRAGLQQGLHIVCPLLCGATCAAVVAGQMLWGAVYFSCWWWWRTTHIERFAKAPMHSGRNFYLMAGYRMRIRKR